MTTARFISPFMTNGNIVEYLENASGSGSLSPRLKLLGDTLNGLVYLHSLVPPICHGDIKPENVLITDRIEAVLCDFGLARLADGQPSGLTTTKAIKGSTRYMSPELVEDGAAHTLSSDVWAYGCLALQVMTGSLPYSHARTDHQVLLKLALNQPPAKLDDLKLQDDQLKTLLKQCWYISPDARPSAFECLQYLPKPGTNGQQLPEKDPAAATPLPAASSPSTAVTSTADSPGQLTMAALTDLDPEKVPPSLKKEGKDWVAIFNPEVQRKLDISLTLSLEHESVVSCVRFSPDGKFLATGCTKTVQIYDTKTGAKTCTFSHETFTKNENPYIRDVRFSPDGKLLATGSEDNLIGIWDIASQGIRQVFSGHLQEIYSLDFSRDGSIIVSASGDQTARIWDVKTGAHQTLFILEPDDVDAGVTAVAISPDGQLVATGSLDSVVRVWDVTTGNLIERLRGHLDSIYSVAFTPDGKGVVSGSLDKTLKYWDLSPLLRSPNRTVALSQGGNVPGGQQPVTNEGGEKGSTCSVTFSGHKDYVLSVAVSPDGAWVVSGSKDRGVRFWDLRTGLTQLMLQGHENSIISIDISPVASPSGGLLASGSGDKTARVWSYHTVKRSPSLDELSGPQPTTNNVQTTFDRTRLRNRDSQGRAQPSLKARKTSDKR